jgi:hypothetical protein
MTVRTPPFNLRKHRVLLATGYKYKRHEANFYNNYNTKNNIEIQTPAYDKYTSEKECIYINVSGEIIRREFRDLEDRRWYEGL